MPRVSVIIPTYNSAQFLPEAIESVLTQTCKDFEIIVIDDGSTDNTKEVILPYMDRIVFLQKANGGPAQTRNLAIRKSLGQYVAFQDADDIWNPEKLERQLKVFEENPQYSLVYSDALIITTDNSHEERLWYDTKRRLKTGWVFTDLLAECFIMVSTVIVKRDCLEQTGLFDENLRIWEGYDLWLRVAFRHQIGFVNAPLLRRRLHGSNTFYSNVHQETLCLIKIMEKWEDQAFDLPEIDRKTINHNLKKDYLRLGGYYISRGCTTKASVALKNSLARGLSFKAIGYLGLCALSPAILKNMRKVKHRLGFRAVKMDRI